MIKPYWIVLPSLFGFQCFQCFGILVGNSLYQRKSNLLTSLTIANSKQQRMTLVATGMLNHMKRATGSKNTILLDALWDIGYRNADWGQLCLVQCQLELINQNNDKNNYCQWKRCIMSWHAQISALCLFRTFLSAGK